MDSTLTNSAAPLRALRHPWLPVAALSALLLLTALPVLTYPLGRDQGMYANIARAILDGGLPYVDMWDIKPPAIYYVYAAGISLFGPGGAAIRAMDLLAVPGVMLGLYWLRARKGHHAAGTWAALLFGVFYFTETFASLSQSDSLITLPMTLAVIAVMLAGDSPRGSRSALGWAWIAGALAASTIWFKQYYAFFVLALVMEHLIRRMADDRRFPLKEALAFSLGGLPVGLIPLLYFVQTGVFGEMLLVASGTAAYNAQAAVSLDVFAAQMAHYLGFRWAHWGPLMVLAGLWLLLRLSGRVRTDDRLAVLWLLSGLAFVLIQAKGFDTHWLPMLSPLSLLGGSALAALLDAVPGARVRRGLTVITAVALLATLAKDTWLRAWPYLSGVQTQAQYYRHFQGNDVKPWESLRLVNYLTRRTQPGDTLYMFGFRPEVAYLSGLPPATRFQAHFPLVSDWYPQSWQQENVDTLWAAANTDQHPPYVLVLQADYLPWVTGKDGDSATLLMQYKALEDWLIFHYERQRTMGDFIIWQRKDL